MDIRFKKIKVIYNYINDRAMKYAQTISWKYRFKVRKKVLKLKSMEFFFLNVTLHCDIT